MEAATASDDTAPEDARAGPLRWLWRGLVVLLVVVALALFAAWLAREEIADNLIESELEKLGIPATYEIVSISPQKQHLRNLVIGDPAAPDLTISDAIVNIDYGWFTTSLGRIQIVEPRLYATYRDGAFSLGSLDPVVFAESDEPPALPELDIEVIDGRALLESDFGALGAKLDGEGRLDDGFSGILALTAPGIGTPSCTAGSLTAYGDLAIEDGAPSFEGPLRARGAFCGGTRLGAADMAARLQLAGDFASLDGALVLDSEELSFAGNRIALLSGDVDFGWSEDGLALRHDLAASNVQTAYAVLDEVKADGAVRTEAGFAQAEWDAEIAGQGLRVAGDLAATLEGAKAGVEGTLAESLLAKFTRNLESASADAAVAASVTVRMNPDALNVLIPEGKVSSGAGETLLAVSRASWSDVSGNSRFSGNFITGGNGLPQINGRMEQTGGGALALRMAMAEYAQGADSIAIPRLQVEQGRSGAFEFAGIVAASGAIPGGSVSGLEAPIDGRWSEAGGLVLGERCTQLRFGSLSLSDVALDGQKMALCPEGGQPMFRYSNEVAVDITTRSLDVTGNMGGSPLVLKAASASIAYPGGFDLSGVSALMGEQGSALSMTADAVTGELGSNFAGSFSGAAAMLDAVPLDLSEISGNWRYAGDTLTIDEGRFVLSDRVDGVVIPRARFYPLLGDEASLTMTGNDIVAGGNLWHPGSARMVANADLEHDLTTGEGRAFFTVPGITFDDALQPDQLSYIVDGVIELAKGKVAGGGAIEWTPDEITSSGSFGTQGLDFAAAFGPIERVAGTVEFTDLINLTTAPGQILEIGSVNPGIEVVGGKVRYSLTDGELIRIEDARWPFMQGQLILRPVDIRYGVDGPQRYTFEVEAVDASTFIAQMELTNLGATGTFDGAIEVAFDDVGNGTIENGFLRSRPPGGNVSYVGDLLYEDMGAISNYAFQSLRSLDYTQMGIELSGELAGEIITNFKIDGVRQGEGSSRNFITKQLAKLPIRFNINVKSQNFYQLAVVARGVSDPTVFGNPIDRGLLRVEDGRIVPGGMPSETPALAPDAPSPPQQPVSETPDPGEIRRSDESPVQPLESDDTP